MSLTSKLVNPTPFNVEFTWDKGVRIVINPDSSIELTMEQVNDFRPENPGFEENKNILDSFGIFLEDSDIDPDVQAVRALKACISEKKRRYSEAKSRLTELMVASNISASDDSPQFQQKLRQMGVSKLLEQTEILLKRVSLYEEALGEEVNDVQVKVPKLDPERTVFVMDPPREFRSKTAMMIYLNEHPDIAKKHYEFLEGQTEGV